MTIRHEQAAPEPARPGEDDRGGKVIPLRGRPASQQDPVTAEPTVEPLWRELVGRQLRAERLARSERIVDVAQRAGVAPQYLSELERGVKDGSSEILAAVSGALGLSVLELARRAGAGQLRRGPVCLAA
ncbi:MAG TPA: helix-turn-helix transcriptional regulator [Jatrophihabitantaceae bacterium]|nr:helix-turn-helix transcriptional regulator [Jatrophihabitantaceae bacterium]